MLLPDLVDSKWKMLLSNASLDFFHKPYSWGIFNCRLVIGTWH